MLHFLKKRLKSIGNAPGTLKTIKPERPIERIIHNYRYNQEEFTSEDYQTIDQCLLFPEKYINWLDFTGYFDAKSISLLGECLNIHPLTLEDILNSDQRTKMEEYEHYLYFVFRTFNFQENSLELESHEIHLILGNDFVLTFSDFEHKFFDPVLKRIKSKKGRIRNMKTDYLAYCLIDSVVDHYFIALNHLGEIIERIDEEIIKNPNKKILEEIYTLRKELIFFRKSIWSLKEVIHNIIKYEPTLFSDHVRVFIKDLNDHTLQVLDSIEIFRDMLIVTMDSFHSMVNHKNNDIMKFLTGVATTFIPLTLIAGIYGMNFKVMPGLESDNGFWLIMIIMIVLSFITPIYFKIKKWW